MQTPPQDRRSIPRVSLLPLERPRSVLDRFPRFSLPDDLAGWGEGRVGDGGVFGVGTGEVAVGDEVLCG